MKLNNEQVTVELKNGTTVWGTLQSVSPQMNATLTDVTLSLPNKVGDSALASIYLSGGFDNVSNKTEGTTLQYINIRGNTIRQIILPDSLNLDSLLMDKEFNQLRKTGKVTDLSNRKRKFNNQNSSNKRVKKGL